jgi:hypothetical protein
MFVEPETVIDNAECLPLSYVKYTEYSVTVGLAT